jgi:hypothetical protein
MRNDSPFAPVENIVEPPAVRSDSREVAKNLLPPGLLIGQHNGFLAGLRMPVYEEYPLADARPPAGCISLLSLKDIAPSFLSRAYHDICASHN